MWTSASHSNQFSAEVSSDRINLSPFTKDYRGLALQCDLHVFGARTRAHHQNRNQQPKRNPCRALFFSRNCNFYFSRPKPLWICLFQVCRNPLDLLANYARAELLKPAGHGGESYLLGLLAKIKCSICSYQLNLWYVAHGVT